MSKGVFPAQMKDVAERRQILPVRGGMPWGA